MRRLALTMGDPCGIGPEVILKALEEPFGAEVRLFGAKKVFEQVERALGLEVLGGVEVVEVMPEYDMGLHQPGVGQAQAASVQLLALEGAIRAAKGGEVDAIVTAPWTKEIFRLVGKPAWGHTEVLAQAWGREAEHVMMLAGPRLRVSLATVHLPLAKVSEALTQERLVQVMETTIADLRRLFGIPTPRLAVCGLNPHAGEHGVMGWEEERVIRPAMARVASADREVSLSGPFSADTLFVSYVKHEMPYDAVICMYHDQGLIPLKLLHFGQAANITLGLPVVRTSVDHGTAYDIAGTGQADASSMRWAMECALELVGKKG